MTSTDSGQYGPGQPIGTSTSFYSYGTQTSCASYPTGWEEAGPFITGILTFVIPDYTYAPSACATASQNVPASEVSTVGFDSFVAVYANDIYVGAPDSPPTAAELTDPVAYCVQSNKVGFVDVGTDVLIYQSSGQYYATLHQGRQNGASFEGSYVKPFLVTVNVTFGEVQVSGTGLNLSIVRNGTKNTTGTANLVIDGNASPITPNCWLTTP